MVGIVAVSHSRALAEAAVELARAMLPHAGAVIEVAAGVQDEQGDRLGTDAMAIAEAIRRADDGDGVVVLTDLGSAVLSAEMALELLSDAAAAQVVISTGPFVEGLVIATVAAVTGADRAKVASQANDALAVKSPHR